MRTVLVTGGTGFIGRPLCERLLSLGFNIYVLTRRKDLANLHQTNIIYINQLAALRQINIDIVINFTGESISTRWTRAKKRAIYDSRITFTRTLVDYIHETNKKPTLWINGSAVGYYGIDADQGHERFAQYLCQEWEKAAFPIKKLGARLVFLRMGPVIASDGGIIAKLLPSFRFGLGAIVGHGKQWFSWIDRDDLINIILFIIDHSQIEGVVNATAPYPVSNEVFSKALARVLNKPCLYRLPHFLIKCLFGEMGEEIMLQGQRVLPTRLEEEGFSFSCPTIDVSLKKWITQRQDKQDESTDFQINPSIKDVEQ